MGKRQQKSIGPQLTETRQMIKFLIHKYRQLNSAYAVARIQNLDTTGIIETIGFYQLIIRRLFKLRHLDQNLNKELFYIKCNMNPMIPYDSNEERKK